MNKQELENQLISHNENLIKHGHQPEVASFIFTCRNAYSKFLNSVNDNKLGDNLFPSLEASFEVTIEKDVGRLLKHRS